jgi:hypothetical protein
VFPPARCRPPEARGNSHVVSVKWLGREDSARSVSRAEVGRDRLPAGVTPRSDWAPLTLEEVR